MKKRLKVRGATYLGSVLTALALLFFALHNRAVGQTPTLLGDLNNDSALDVRDLQLLLNHLNHSQSSIRRLSTDLLPYADVNEDGYLNQADVTLLRDAILGTPIPVNTRPVALEPATGSSDVGVTVRPKAIFPKPIDIATLNSNNFYATFAGRRLAATITPANNGAFAWLFFHELMPNASQVQVIVDGSTLRTRTGLPLDADGDGALGGVMRFNFSTVSVAPIPGTVLSSRIVDPGPDLIPRTVDDVIRGNGFTYLLPIQGVRVHVLGMENNVAYTDADGRFTLTNMPVGNVKVVLDGRTATNPPVGYYFPEMVMDTTFEPGITNGVMNIVDTNGVVVRDPNGIPIRALAMYLPRVASNVLQTVSAGVTNLITLQSNAAYDLPPEQQQYLTVEIMPGSLIGMDGRPLATGQVGVSVVPPELVRDMLPPGLLQHTFDITVQAPGIATFATPAPMTFPNVFNAPPGTKLNFLSFDHTTGRLVIEGTATVSEDGLFVRTDPGTGITHPGWHGLAPPGVPATGGPITGPPGGNPNDIDGDGDPNDTDPDDDNDGEPDTTDPDIDGDGIPNGQDSDMDGDGTPNDQDNDMDGDGMPNDQDPDPDGPDGQCTVSIAGTNQGNCGDTLTLNATVSVTGGTYGWSIVGSGGELIFPLPGQSAAFANVKLNSVGQVTVYLTYRPPGSNSADTQCNASSVITVSMGQPTIRIVSISGSATWANDASRHTFLSTDTITARAEGSACQAKVRWSVIGQTGTAGTVWVHENQNETFSFVPASLSSGGVSFAQYRMQNWTSACDGANCANQPIQFDLKAELVDDSGNSLVSSLLSTESVGRMVQDDIDRLRQEYVDYGFSLPPRAQVVSESPTALFPTSRFIVSGNARGGNYPFVVDAGFTAIAEAVYSHSFPSGGGRLTITSYYRNPRAQGAINPGVSESYHVRGRAVDIAISAAGLNPIDLYRAATAATSLEVLLEDGTTVLLPENWRPPTSTPDSNNDLGGGVLWNDTNGNGIPDLLVTSQGASLPAAGQVFTLKSESYVVNSGRTTLLFRDSTASLRNLDALFSQATHVHAAK